MSGIYRICPRECCSWRRLCVAVPGNAEVRCVFFFFFFLIFGFIFWYFLLLYTPHTHIYIHLFYVNCCCGRAKWHSFTIIISFFRLCFFFLFCVTIRPSQRLWTLPAFPPDSFPSAIFVVFFFFLREKKRRKRGGTTATAIISLPLKRRSQNIK